MKLPELRALLKEKKLCGYSHYNKLELIDLLRDKVCLPEEATKPKKELKEVESGTS